MKHLFGLKKGSVSRFFVDVSETVSTFEKRLCTKLWIKQFPIKKAVSCTIRNYWYGYVAGGGMLAYS